MSGWQRRPPAYRGTGGQPAPAEMYEVRPGRHLSVAHHRGDHTTIVFVHGAGGNRQQFAPLWAHFAASGHTLLAWDAFGHGDSPRFDPRRPQQIDGAALLDDFEILLNRHAVGTTLLVGHSLGARLVLALLLRLAGSGRLHRIGGAVLIAPAALAAPTHRALFGPLLSRLPRPLLELARPLAGRRFRDRAWHPGTDRALIAAERSRTRRNSLAMIGALLTRAPSIPPAALAVLRLPIRVLAGEADRLVPMAAIRAVADALPQARLQIVAGAAHQVMLEQPGTCIAAIEALCAEVHQ